MFHMSKTNRLRSLLATGYFPEELLPPPFQTFDFARHRTVIGKAWAAVPNHYPKTSPEIYSSPKQQGWRRDFSIVNPIAQFHVAKLIADNWTTIKSHLAQSYSSEPVEIRVDGRRSVPRPDFELVRLRHAEVTALYDYVLVADISRFYGTLYTHAIPWALHTKPWCKANLNKPAYDASLGAKLDWAVRRGNDNQTLGIPVGPDTSRVLAEIVAASVDASLRKKLKLTSIRAVRHVDDWFIGFDTLGDAEAAVSALSASCRDYQLEIHPEKTRCVHVPREVSPIWSSTLRNLKLETGARIQRRSIDHFFEQSFHFAGMYPKENVLSYAVSRSRRTRVRQENWPFYETHLLKAARANATTLPTIVSIFASYNAWGYPVDKERIAKLIEDLIRNSAPSAFHSEVAWALFLAKALKITLKAKSLAPVTELESSVCALIALDLRSLGLIDGQLNTNLWQQSMNDAGLTSNMWLLAYEAELKGWLTGATQYVDAHPYFSELKKRGISFYNLKKNVTDISKLKPKPPSEALLKLLQHLSGQHKKAAAALPIGGAQAQPPGAQQAPAAVGLAQAFIQLGDYWEADDMDDFGDYL
jgi:hypothetical protein